MELEHASGEDPSTVLLAIVRRVAHLLPAQGPIRVFIHHNTLHAFEHLAFEDAVVRAAERFGCEPFLREDDYRRELDAGRILASDIETVLAHELGPRGEHRVGGLVPRFDLRRGVVLHGIPEALGPALAWRLGETDVLRRRRRDLPDGDRTDASAARASWEACVRAVERGGPRFASTRPRCDGIGICCWPRSASTPMPGFIRLSCGSSGAFLDQGLAYWPMPGRERGLFACFVDLYGGAVAKRIGAWARSLPALVADERASGRTAVESLAHSLDRLGVPQPEWTEFLTDTALALRGFAGLVHQIEERPDRVTTHAVPATLVDFLAVRLLLERAAIGYAVQDDPVGRAPLSAARDLLRQRLPRPASPGVEERAWPLFHLAQICRLPAATIDAIDELAIDELEQELRTFGEVERRRVLHLAYERRLRLHLYDALAGHRPRSRPQPPAFQAVFCIDEREESIRRHLEEVDPDVETFGAAGFFGVAMYHRGAGDAHPRPLCPVAIRPEHYVEEAGAVGGGSRVLAGLLGHNIDLGSRTLVRGAILMTLLGALALVPLVLGVAFPWLARRVRRMSQLPATRGPTRLLVERRDTEIPIGRWAGFTVEEMTAIVRRLLEDTGMRDALAPLVLVIGHGSVSLNNPHESAHDCGACGGGHGGPNARAFAQMANDPRVRRNLAAQGLVIDASTWFVGGERNSSSSAIDLYDLDLVPNALREVLARARLALEDARRREAHERCRRFDGVPHWYPPAFALAHVEGRAHDLAQPRPEYGHATNAFCIVGRRARTLGLFLDRRAFLVSYDPTTDEHGDVLARLLGAVVPVVAGISLEYWFGRVDPIGYGCGTKLPHNITALLGVMDGAQSDLRTGLPWQMVEIHEPVRLTIVVEAPAERLEAALRGDPQMERLVRNQWIVLARLDPDAATVSELGAEGFVEHVPEHPVPVVEGSSITWYAGERDHLPIAAIERGPA